jgi:hypothetical protein
LLYARKVAVSRIGTIKRVRLVVKQVYKLEQVAI